MVEIARFLVNVANDQVWFRQVGPRTVSKPDRDPA
jgi:hypothetical protein